jgi:hypothetical protein
MAATKAPFALGAITKLRFEARLELSFFKTRPIVLSLARSTMSSSTTSTPALSQK